MMTPPSVFIIFTLHMKLTLIGAGKLGKQLYYEFVKHPSIELIEWIDRSSNSKQTAEGIKITKSLDSLQKAEIYLMAVNDDAIPSVSSQLPSNEFVIHTSGGTPMTAISQKEKGFFILSKALVPIEPSISLKLPLALSQQQRTISKYYRNWLKVSTLKQFN